MKNLKIVFIFFILIFAFSVKVYSYSDSYYFDSCDFEIIVNKDNTYQVTEKVKAKFLYKNMPIQIEIPLKCKAETFDGRKYQYKATVENLTVSDKYNKVDLNDNLVLNIGEYDDTESLEKEYEIKYTYNLKNDTVEGIDEFYFKFIGKNYDIFFENISFKIIFPEEINEEKLKFLLPENNILNSLNDFSYEVQNNVIKGSTRNTSLKDEFFAVQLELPDNYFEHTADYKNVFNYMVIVMNIIFIAFSYIIWFKYGKDEKVGIANKFEIPEGLNSAEVGTIYNGKVNNKSVLSLLLYLANKGYLKIDFEDRGSKSGIKITKLKEYNGHNESEKLFFRGIFRDSRLICSRQDLFNSFYITVDNIKGCLDGEEFRKKHFSYEAERRAKFLYLLIFVSILLTSIIPTYNFINRYLFSFHKLIQIVAGIIFALLPSTIYTAIISLFFDDKDYSKIYASVLGITFTILNWFLLIKPMIIMDTFYLISFILTIITIILILICIKFMPKRTNLAKRVLEQINAFKDSINKTKPEELEKMFKENPKFFWDILPYAYAVGIPTSWMREFEDIALVEPNAFHEDDFTSFVNGALDKYADKVCFESKNENKKSR